MKIILNLISNNRSSQRLNGILIRLLTILGMSSTTAKQCVSEYKDLILHSTKHYGLVTTTKVLKDLHSDLKRSALGVPGSSPELGGIWFKRNKRGHVSRVSTLYKMIKNHPKAVMTLTGFYRLIKLPVTLGLEEVKSIESPASESASEHFRGQFCRFLDRAITSKLSVKTEVPYHFSTKAGPNGPALMTIGLDTLATYKSKTFKTFIELLNSVGFTALIDAMNSYAIRNIETLKSLSYRAEPLEAKLIALPDKGGKTRVVYILSYWYQEALRPLHDTLMSWLKSQKQDCTFSSDHNSKMEEETKENSLVCYDLSKATDRLPTWIQYEVLLRLVGKNWADLWLDRMAVKPYAHNLKRFITYQVGQPMGAYASWAAMAVTHHMVWRFCHWWTKSAAQYWVLGDDSAARSRKASALYYHVMTAELGVEISETKSISPEDADNSDGNIAEFANRIYKDGKNISAVSLELVLKIDRGMYWMVYDLLYSLGVPFPISKDGVPALHKDTLYVLTLFGVKVRVRILVLLGMTMLYQGEDESTDESEVETPLSSDWVTLPAPLQGLDSLIHTEVFRMNVLSELVRLHEPSAQLMSTLAGFYSDEDGNWTGLTTTVKCSKVPDRDVLTDWHPLIEGLFKSVKDQEFALIVLHSLEQMVEGDKVPDLQSILSIADTVKATRVSVLASDLVTLMTIGKPGGFNSTIRERHLRISSEAKFNVWKKTTSPSEMAIIKDFVSRLGERKN